MGLLICILSSVEEAPNALKAIVHQIALGLVLRSPITTLVTVIFHSATDTSHCKDASMYSEFAQGVVGWHSG